jgi:hypothetical protein
LELRNKFNQNEVQLRLARHHVGYDGSSVFTTTMFTANRVASNISSAQRSLYFWWCNNRIFIFDSNTSYPFNFEIFLKWE